MKLFVENERIIVILFPLRISLERASINFYFWAPNPIRSVQNYTCCAHESGYKYRLKAWVHKQNCFLTMDVGGSHIFKILCNSHVRRVEGAAEDRKMSLQDVDAFLENLSNLTKANNGNLHLYEAWLMVLIWCCVIFNFLLLVIQINALRLKQIKLPTSL